MGSTLVAVLAGWLTLAGWQAAQSAGRRIGQAARAAPRRRPGKRSMKMPASNAAKSSPARLAACGSSEDGRGGLRSSRRPSTWIPSNSNAWNGLGWARFNGGDSKEAIAAFEKCVEIEPKHPAGLNGLGQVYLSGASYAKAEKFLLKAAPNASAAWYGLSRLYLLTGKYDKAKTWIEKRSASSRTTRRLSRCWLPQKS